MSDQLEADLPCLGQRDIDDDRLRYRLAAVDRLAHLDAAAHQERAGAVQLVKALRPFG
jgi:hypothetical protein